MIEDALLPILKGGVIPVMLGGDYSIKLPELRGMAKIHVRVALIPFDSHSDTGAKRDGRLYTHGTLFRRAIEEELILVDHSIQVGMRGSIYSRNNLNDARKFVFDLVTSVKAQEKGIRDLIWRIRDCVGEVKALVSFDIDFVDPAYEPETGTPEVGGFTSGETLRVVRGLKSLDLIAFDLVEVLSQYDPSQITALIAANIIYEFISLIALRRN